MTVRALLEAAVLCNDANVQRAGAGRWTPVGDPTEIALVTLAMKGGVDPAEVRARHPRLSELPFDPAAKLMATAHAGADGASWVVVKGAPEEVLALCRAARHGDRVVARDDEQGRSFEATERLGDMVESPAGDEPTGQVLGSVAPLPLQHGREPGAVSPHG